MVTGYGGSLPEVNPKLVRSYSAENPKLQERGYRGWLQDGYRMVTICLQYG